MKRIVESFEEFTENGKIPGAKLVIGETSPYNNGSMSILAKLMSADFTYIYGILIFDNHLPYGTKEIYSWGFDTPDLISRIGEYAPLPLELKNFLETQDWYNRDLTEEEMRNSLDILKSVLN